ncbi:transcription initiation factor IIB family protein [Haloquadratum walsbyi]|uniref:Transcription initiation factor IIB n=1 Tax=Haloquadratum walsbyi J07HQW2 TaxID=1238425 RepID=U1MYP3_9EURY|nr:TFIIB-type zinc ribbon-containing protein [Haloquadratum walsbyi]ERG95624.1 MAG: transcription initiation factor TFIIIB, Brf1 subunit/Transcription initiation factor TFIIB [Haloquadratum walsbyi J07HQW2]
MHINNTTFTDETKSDTSSDVDEAKSIQRDDNKVEPESANEYISGDRIRCPECDGDTVASADGSKTICSACGLIITEDEIDRGPEWRAFDANERDKKARVGSPTTTLMHDKGLSTNIGWQNKDAHGQSVSAEKRRKLKRLRTWNERIRTQGSKDRNLKHALGEIDRMASALGIHQTTRETASMIYRQALKADLLPGRSIEAVATAVLYASSRMDGVARSIDEVATVSRVPTLEIKRTYRYIIRELDIQIPPTNPIEYIGRFASAVGCDDETKRRARALIQQATSKGVHSGKHPVGIAASALYAAGQLCDAKLTQSEISKAADVSEVTIRNRYREILEASEGVTSP